MLENLAREGYLAELIHAGARIHQAGCNGWMGMGQAPATGKNSLRTTPRNFPGRSGNKEDSVFLCSPEIRVGLCLMNAAMWSGWLLRSSIWRQRWRTVEHSLRT